MATHQDGMYHYGARHRRSKWGECDECYWPLRKFVPLDKQDRRLCEKCKARSIELEEQGK